MYSDRCKGIILEKNSYKTQVKEKMEGNTGYIAAALAIAVVGFVGYKVMKNKS